MSRSDRRGFLIGSAAWAAATVGLTAAETAPAQAGAGSARETKLDALRMPGPFRGQVVEVAHPGSVVDGRVNREAVREMVRRGMLELTGEKDAASAWRRFFAKGDDQILLSPAAVDLGGLCIIPVEKDFHRIGKDQIVQMFNEVCLNGPAFQALCKGIAAALPCR